MNPHRQHPEQGNAYPLEEVLCEEVPYAIQRTVQDGRTSICEGYIRRSCASSPEFILACEAAERSGLNLSI